jgi:hypothetical protein
MGILELIKLGRIFITTVHFIEDVAEYDESGLDMRFSLNRDYIPPSDYESEFDHTQNETDEEDDTENE